MEGRPVTVMIEVWSIIIVIYGGRHTMSLYKYNLVITMTSCDIRCDHIHDPGSATTKYKCNSLSGFVGNLSYMNAN